jgi:hypothetical protein
MRTVGDEFFEPLARLRDFVRPRNAERVEAVGACGFGQRLLELNGVAQKSRSA